MPDSQKPHDSSSRRAFLRGAAAASMAGVFATQARASKPTAPNDRLRVGFIGTGGRCQAHIDRVLSLQAAGGPVEAAAVCDVYTRNRDTSAEKIQKRSGSRPMVTGDWREVLDSGDIDVVCVATPDHWHARMTIDALAAGKHVYCEKPMTHTVEEGYCVLQAWRESGKVMQVGVQRTSDGRWDVARELIDSGKIGKVVQCQTEYYRNSGTGQWRYYGLSRDMTPANIDWKMFLGTEFGLAPSMPFDRAKYRQWRCYWPFGSGLYTDLFVHRVTQILKATGLREPRRVVGAGGIFLEYDGRDVPDTATVVADFNEGVQLLVTATMCNAHPIEQCIRGHFGTLVFTLDRDGFDFRPERPQVTRLRDQKVEHISAPMPEDETMAHWENFIEAVQRDDPMHVNNPPDLAAAAVTTVNLGARSYREGRVFEWDAVSARAQDSGPAYADAWEALSHQGANPRHVPGWNADPLMGSRQQKPDHQKLEGPWTDPEVDPAGNSARLSRGMKRR